VEWDSLGFKTFPDVESKSYKLQKLSISEKQAEYLDEICADMAISPKNVGYLYLFLAEAVKSMVTTHKDSKSLIVERARKYIDEHNELHVSELAKYCNMSESGLYKFFRDNLDTTPIGFKNQIKVNRAVNMLKYTSASVEEISTELGFSNAAYFRKIFKGHTGKTPLKIRKEAKHI
jgi:AraC-like DNA-binding protein